MKWYYVLMLVCVIIAPFDALYVYIKSEKRKDALRNRKPEKQNNDKVVEDGQDKE